jgi:alpha-ketoglutarate-dependent taurine dioxygenase
MTETGVKMDNLSNIPRAERRAIRIESDKPVRFETSQPGSRTLPLIIHSPTTGLHLHSWMTANRAVFERALLEHGGILFRGFQVGGIDGFRNVVSATGAELEQYTYRSTPRTELGGGIYTSTEYPADKSIPLHNENSYSDAWPRRVFFYCELPAQQGGETPIADSYRVFDRIPSDIREKFIAKKVMYVRNYGWGVDLPWQEVFQTSDRDKVELFCGEHGVQVEWLDGERLRTRQVCQAVAGHPDTGKMAWFNQAHLFHISSLEPAVHDALLEAFSEDELPRNACYGDGSRIADDELNAVREAYAQEEVCTPWQPEDVLLVDNMAVAHGRKPFKGDRKIRVAMTHPMNSIQYREQ